MNAEIEQHFIAFVPVMNSGRRDQCAQHQFFNGAKITQEAPDLVQRAVLSFSQEESISRREAMCLETAYAWLWKCTSARCSSGREMLSVCGDLANSLKTVLACIDLAGGGENNYWRGPGLECCGVYLFSTEPFPLHVNRLPFRNAPPTQGQRESPWTATVLACADDLARALAGYSGPPIARLALASDVREAMVQVNPERWRIRLHLSFTAIETFYIAPNERKYFWDDEITRRIRDVCGSEVPICPDYFSEARVLRNDLVHRSGQTNDKSGQYNRIRIARETEEILRCTIRWGILNQGTIAQSFERDEWPNTRC